MLGKSSLPAHVGVGSHDPDAVSSVGSPDVVSSQHVPFRIKPERGQVSEHDAESANSEHWGVFHEREPGSYLPNDASELRPEPAALSRDARPRPRARDVLAGEAPADDVDVAFPGLAVEGSDVIPDGEGREQPVPLTVQEHPAAVGINLDSAHGAPAKEDPSQDPASCPCKKCQFTHGSLSRLRRVSGPGTPGTRASARWRPRRSDL